MASSSGPLDLVHVITQSDLWMDKIKGVLTGPKEKPAHYSFSQPSISTDSFALPQFADGLKNAKGLGTFKQYMVGRSSEATFADAFEKQEAILQYFGSLDPSGEKLQSYQKQEAAKYCNCTIADVENTLAKFTWAKEAQKKMEKLKDEGKPLPMSMAEVLWKALKELLRITKSRISILPDF